MRKGILSLIKWLFSEIIASLVVILFLAAGLTLFYKYREARRNQSPAYTRGVITDRYDRTRGLQRGARFRYRFTVNGRSYVNSARRSMCSDCKDISCVIGDSLLIEYRTNNPANNKPVCNK